jgi:2-dehydro-3-deoxy-D-arabinonate dehydratase
MRLAQIVFPSGVVRAGLLEGGEVVELTGPESLGVVDLIRLSSESGRSLAEVVAGYSTGDRHSLDKLLETVDRESPRLAIPLFPPEVWGCGVTYRRSAEFRDEDAQTAAKGIYDQVYSSPRPEIFFKATAARCVGPGEAIGVRSDSTFTAPEPELALVLARDGRIVGYTIADDVSAWDIERENPLYLPQSKIYQGCCALGPTIVTPDEVGGGRDLRLVCRIYRDGRLTYEGEVNTERLGRSFVSLIHYLTLDNPIPDGTVVCTGTGVIVPFENALAPGDLVEIEVEKLGVLRNPVRRVGG